MSIDKGVNLPCFVAFHGFAPRPCPYSQWLPRVCLLPECPKDKCDWRTASLGAFPLGCHQVSVPAAPGYALPSFFIDTTGEKRHYHHFGASIFAVLLEKTELWRMGCSIQAALSPEGLSSSVSSVQKSPQRSFEFGLAIQFLGNVLPLRSEEQLWHSFSAKISLFFWDCSEAQQLSNHCIF